ncbi:MAG: TIM barrel protein [Candidatus Baldrarchaeia archaeon]
MALLRFGPSGTLITNDPLNGLTYLVKNFPELKAFEIPFTIYQYELPVFPQRYFEKFRTICKDHGVVVSLHAPFTISLTNEKQFKSYGKKRLLKCLRIAKNFGCRVVVLHPGGYQPNISIDDHIRIVTRNCREVMSEISGILLGLETTGKHRQFGKLDELLEVVSSCEGVTLVVDWAHLYARSGGRLKTNEDVIHVLEKIEEILGSDILFDLHMHFTGVEFSIIRYPSWSLDAFTGSGGKQISESEGTEKKHLEVRSGRPSPELVLKVLKERGVGGTLICESPLKEQDAQYLLSLYHSI